MKLNLIILIVSLLPLSLLCNVVGLIQNDDPVPQEEASPAQPVEPEVAAEPTATTPPSVPTDTPVPQPTDPATPVVQAEVEPTVAPTEAATSSEASPVTQQDSEPSVITWSGENQPIAYGAVAQGTIAQIGDRHTYVFEGREGERLTAFLQGRNFFLYLVGPDDRGAQCSSRGNTQCQIDNIMLPETANYELIVDGAQDNTGEYTLFLTKLADTAAPISYGQTVEGTISMVGSQHDYSFEGQEGEQVTVLLNGKGFRLYLIGPNDKGWKCSTAGVTKCQIDNAKLSVTGQYTITIDGFQNRIGDYSLTVVKNSN